MDTSPRFKLNKEDVAAVVKAMVYSAISSLLAALTAILAQPQLPTGKAFLVALAVPVANGALVALKKFLDDHGTPFWSLEEAQD